MYCFFFFTFKLCNSYLLQCLLIILKVWNSKFPKRELKMKMHLHVFQEILMEKNLKTLFSWTWVTSNLYHWLKKTGTFNDSSWKLRDNLLCFLKLQNVSICTSIIIVVNKEHL